jgi:hypothetical protein
MRVSGWPCLSRPQPPVAVVDALGRRRGMLSTARLSLSGLWTYTMRWDTTAAGRGSDIEPPPSVCPAPDTRKNSSPVAHLFFCCKGVGTLARWQEGLWRAEPAQDLRR